MDGRADTGAKLQAAPKAAGVIFIDENEEGPGCGLGRSTVATQVYSGPNAAKGLKNRVQANLLYLPKVRELVAKEGGRETAT